MTNTPNTSPEAVERLAKTCDVASAIASRRRLKAQHAHHKNCAAALRTLSGERDELKITLAYCEKQWTDTDRVTQEKMIDERKRAEAAEQASRYESDLAEQALQEMRRVRGERDALKAELAEAKMHVAEMITAFEEHVALPDKNCSCHISPPCGDCTENDYARETLSEARAFLARHQKETDT